MLRFLVAHYFLCIYLRQVFSKQIQTIRQTSNSLALSQLYNNIAGANLLKNFATPLHFDSYSTTRNQVDCIYKMYKQSSTGTLTIALVLV